jgi:ATP-binding cassette, subfamily C (CFTR/MRP), member 10
LKKELHAIVEDRDEENSKKEGIIKDENSKKEAHKVDYGVIYKYFGLSFCGKISVFIILALHVLINVATSSLSFYLAFALSDGKSLDGVGRSLTLIVVICLLTTVVGKVVSSLIFMSINRNLHSIIVSSIIKTKMQFFDENTSGAILNRMSKDIAVSDQIVFNFLEMIDYIIKCVFSVAFIVYSSPWISVIVFLQLWYFRNLRRRVIVVTRDCFGLKQTLNAPTVSLIQDSLNGQVLMRTLGVSEFFL